MKILVFGGGLGNQLLGYAFAEYVRDKYHQEKVYGVYNKKMLSEHYGLEIAHWFEVQLPPSRWWVSLVTYILYALKKIFGWKGLLDLDQYVVQNDNALVYFAQHTDKRYIPEGEWINFKVDENSLSNSNQKVLTDIKTKNSVFIHVRRGDYLSPKYKDRFEGCCTLDYYKAAVDYIESHVADPCYYIFSNDIEWTKQNLLVNNPTYINWNTGTDSPLDMYLMSQCKYGIMANSTFSWWAAILGIKKGIITYPERWVNPPFKSGDIFYDEWVKL